MTKKEYRQTVIDRRKKVSPEDMKSMSRRVVENIESLDEFRKADIIFAYMEMPGEVQMRTLIEDCWKMGKRVAVPKVEGRVQHFYEITGWDKKELVDGVWHIQEPDPAKCACLDDCEQAFMVMPGVAFDDRRHRIGYGGGYYDRYLDLHRQHPTCAAAFELQFFEEVPTEPHDLLPEHIATETRVIS